ncbi:MAG: serine/threonine protein kinase [Blastocatellia bacterium]|nr:serine/threonine protein kinase [Blastocatellia bacterium]MBN8724042.1 serine/threonine protein kinase [Acidobacteriota bacterium]
MKKKICAVCNQEWPEGMKHCPKDGARLTTLIQRLESGDILADKYHIIETIGEGAMGTVYKAKRSIIEDFVAVKTLRPELISSPVAIERFRREAQASGRIRHPNAISIFDFGVADGIAFLVMEFLEGLTLRQILNNDSPLPIKRTVKIFLQICGAVQRAHRKGVIHRDLKPENIILEEFEGLGETVKVIDFSLAKLKIAGASMQSLTEKGRVAGTPYYMSPEQWLDKELDPRTDVYSLGVMLYEALTKRMPFEADTIMELAKKHVQASPTPLNVWRAEIPQKVSEVILKSMSKKAEDRQQSALSLGQELRAAAGLESDEDALPYQLKRLNPTTSSLNGALIIYTRPPNSNVYLNNHYVGTSDDRGSLLLQKIPLGQYKATIVRIGYQDWEQDVEIGQGASTVEARLEPKKEVVVNESTN